MARDLNKVMLTGRLGKDVELRVTPNGRSVATFSVASSRNIREGDNWKEQTEWFRVVAWEKLAETCSNFLHKGSHVFIEGRLQTREWQDKDGQKRFSTEVIATDMTMLDSKGQNSGGGSGDINDAWDNAGSPASGGRSGGNRPRSNDFDEGQDLEDIPF
ncbi:MAG: single-strand binding protein [Chloroflexi bacterium]|jgi:single-strand DNA-binding protein|nr:single-strand binding protein [Chloroflexota bacterium]